MITCALCLGAMYLAYCRNQGSGAVVWTVVACCCWPCYLVAKIVKGEAHCVMK